MQKEIKKAVESAEQEIQEKEIANLKFIIKDLLENKVRLEKNKRHIEEEISVIKKTIDDFKAGRLDKIKELQEKDSVAKEVLPFKIVIVNRPVITQPWGWTYQVQPNHPIMTLTNRTFLGDAISVSASNGLSGNCYATFATGSYNVSGGNGIINL